jgi:hypothetical protein
MIASQLHRALILAAMLTLPSGGATYAVQDSEAADADAQQTASEQSPAANAEQAIPEAPKKLVKPEDKGKQLYFFGGRPQLNRQLGPALNAPKSILPQPFLPKGSVEIPPAPEQPVLEPDEAGMEGEDVSGTLEEATVEGQIPENTGLEGDVGVAASEQGLNTPSDQNVPDYGTPATVGDDLLEASTLDLLDPSGMALIPAEEGYAPDFWDGYSRAEIAAKLADFKSPGTSPALKAIASHLALSATRLDAPETDTDVTSFIEARLDLLAAVGNAKAYTDLLLSLPASHDWSVLSRHFANAYLLDGKITDACDLAGTQRENDTDPYWLKLIAFCEATAANRAGVDFQLGILEEIINVDPAFYQLIDQILVEAEQPPGAVLPAPVTLASPVRIDVLEATMARLARVRVESLAAEGVNPLSVSMMISLPGVLPQAKTDLIGLAVRRGWVGGDMFALYARSVEATADAVATAELMAAEDSSFQIDATFAKAATIAPDEATRAAALSKVWQRIASQNYSMLGGRGMFALLGNSTPKASASAVVLARSAIAAGKPDVAASWFRALRSQAAGTDPDIDRALVDLVPLMALMADEGVTLDTATLQIWWEAQALNEKRYEQANLLFSLLEALGEPVSDEAWGWLESGPVTLAGSAPAPAQWRRFLIAAHAGDRPAVLAALFRLLSDGGPAEVSASLAGSIVGTLKGLGLEREAKAVAAEILIGQGL